VNHNLGNDVKKHDVVSLWYFGLLLLEGLRGKFDPVYIYRQSDKDVGNSDRWRRGVLIVPVERVHRNWVSTVGETKSNAFNTKSTER